MTLAEAIAKCLADGCCSTAVGGTRVPGFPLTDEDKAFLHRWAGALHKQEWKRNAEKFPNPDHLIWRTIAARRSAKDDNGDSKRKKDELWQSLQEHQVLANMADCLLDHYERVAEANRGRPDDVSDHIANLIECQSTIVHDLHRDFFIIYEHASNVHLSTKTTERERMLFMQHMSREMQVKWGDCHDSTVAAITSLMYQVPVSAKAVISQRKKMPLRATVKLPWTKSTTPFQRALLRSRR
jgi:hypothetical protein